MKLVSRVFGAGRAWWWSRGRAFVKARLDPRAYLGLRLTVSLVAGGLALWALSALLDAVLDNATLVHWDIIISDWVHQRVTPAGLSVFRVITDIGSPTAMAVLAVVGGLVLLARRRWIMTIAWAGAFIGGSAIERFIKLVVHRSRPAVLPPSQEPHTFSFPSGHATGAMIGASMVLYVISLYWHPGRRAWIAMVCVATAFVVLVGTSRIYLGVHYPSDVLGGYATGAAWVSVCVSGHAMGRYATDA